MQTNKNRRKGNESNINLEDIHEKLDSNSAQLENMAKYLDVPIARYVHSGNKEVVITGVEVATGIFTSAAHGLINGDTVVAVLNQANIADYPVKYWPTGLGPARYYVVEKTTDTFKLSTTSGGAAVTYTTNATQDLTKWHIERYAAGVNITGIGTLQKCKVIVKGIIPRFDYLLPYNTTPDQYATATYLKSGVNTIGSLPMGVTGNVYAMVEYYFDTKDFFQIYQRGLSIYGSTVSANATATVINYLTDTSVRNITFANIGISGAYLVNGTIVEVYKA